MVQTKTTIPKALAAESEQAIHFLTLISEQLKQQRRHFDDAVVTHCLRLINDYAEDKSKEVGADGKPVSNGNGRHI